MHHREGVLPTDLLGHHVLASDFFFSSYLFIPLSMTLTTFQGQSSVKQFCWKIYVLTWVSWNFVGLLSTSTRPGTYHYVWHSPLMEFVKDSFQPFRISLRFASRFSDFYCYYLLFRKVVAKKKKGRKSSIGSDFQSKFSKLDVDIFMVHDDTVK